MQNPAGSAGRVALEDEFVDSDLINRIVGVSPCHPQARTGGAVLTQTCEQGTPPAGVQGAGSSSGAAFGASVAHQTSRVRARV